MEKIFDTGRKIRLGIWGLGRGSTFIRAARLLNIEIVAGCDLDANLRERFKSECPDAVVTADEQEFLAIGEMDAVLIATFFQGHAEHTIRALRANKHVMCEVTSFFTPAEGVAVVEAVERSGKVYNLLENYPFSKENMYLSNLWRHGFFGEFMYGEFDYLHDCRSLCYGYNSRGTPPIAAGNTAHNWRSWLNFHYYNTHSLGPLMKITGLRPEAVSAMPEKIALPGYLPESGMSKACSSTIRMSNGGLMRNLAGATTDDCHTGKRIWGTRAAAESLNNKLRIRIGASGSGLKLDVTPEWPELGEYADTSGHGGGDFWELYYFAREILNGTPSPWNVYDACDVTLAGIMAVRSQHQNGMVIEIPDFRDPARRDRYRNDHWSEEHLDPEHIFPGGEDDPRTREFCSLMLALEKDAVLVRKAFDGAKLNGNIDAAGRMEVLKCIQQVIEQLPRVVETRGRGRRLAELYPDSPAASALNGMMSLAEPELAREIGSVKASLLAELRNMIDMV